MPLLRQFLVVELVSIAVLVLVAAAVGAYGVVDSVSHANSLVGPGSSAWLGFAYTVAIGTLPVVVVGAPIYLVLLRRGSANWINVVALGGAPGVLLLFLVGGLGIWAMVCGVAVASVTHLICRRLGPNNSFKPKPLRGSA